MKPGSYVPAPSVLLLALALCLLSLKLTFPYYYVRLKFGIEEPVNIFIVDAFYYNTSKRYVIPGWINFKEDTLAVIFNTRKNAPSLPIVCQTKDRFDAVATTKADVKILVNAPGQCAFTTFVAMCQGPSEPAELSIGIHNGLMEKIPFSHVDRVPRPLVVCMSRMYLFENWQLLFTSLEIYRHFGATLMVTYIESVLADIALIMDAYEKEGFLKTKPGFRMFKSKGMKYDPNAQTEWGSQLSVYNSCLFEFKESADFIIFADWDDVFIPNNYPSYLEELVFQSRAHPTAGAMVFPRHRYHVTASKSPESFDLAYTFDTLQSEDKQEPGKYVAIPSRVEGSWIHAASQVKRGYEQVWLRETVSSFWHFRDWTIYKEQPNVDVDQNLYSGNSTELAESFKDFLSRNNLTNTFSALPSDPVYYPAMVKCYADLNRAMWDFSLTHCPTAATCDIPQLDVSCVNLRTEFRSTELLSGVNLHQRSRNELYRSSKGCAL
uniref:Glycosyltransferase family 92 protein n=1 Tax=Steinernema glaseri TaxID=37863 RepID=A0A1I8AFD1_9BILA